MLALFKHSRREPSIMSYALSPDELERKWGSREQGHPIFSRKVHVACLANGRTTERDYWKWAASKSGYECWSPEHGWA